MRPALGVHTMNATVGVADAPLGDSVWKSQLSKVLSSPLPARVSCYFPLFLFLSEASVEIPSAPDWKVCFVTCTHHL